MDQAGQFKTDTIPHGEPTEVFEKRADATMTDTDDARLVNEEIMHFQNWCNIHRMSINFTKSKIMNVNFGHCPLSVISNLTNVSVLKILGLVLNDKLTWADHIDFIIKKLSQRLYVLRVLKPVMSHDDLVVVFNAIFLSVIDYASPVFLNCSSYLNNKLVILCKRAFRVIHGYDVKECISCAFLEVEGRRRLLSLKLFKSALISKDHVLHSFLPTPSPRTCSRRLILPHVNTTRRSSSFAFCVQRCIMKVCNFAML